MPQNYHAGEMAIQAQADTVERAAKMARTVGTTVPNALSRFLTTLRWALIGGTDDAGRVWASPVFGEAGFIHTPTDTEVRIAAHIPAGDPLHEAGPGSAGRGAGMLAIDLQRRMRARINGTLRADDGGMTLRVAECYANCPKHIHNHEFAGGHVAARPIRTRSDRVPARGHALVRESDTMFIASIGPDSSADVSHRGGPSGFIECSADGTTVRFPDYPGNGVFNTLGNLHSDTRAGLTVFGFETNELLQLTGYASSRPMTASVSTRQRVVEFNVLQAVWTENAEFAPETATTRTCGHPAPAGAG
jgi:predicted pyridoxine 5'-phosphate oxidase superfamily flavin-nucleotide-binding protein